MKLETRNAEQAWPGADLEIRMAPNGMNFTGYAAVFDSPSEPMPWTERITPGAFTRTLKHEGRNVRMFVNHNTDQLLATSHAKTLRLFEDEKGLRVEADLPDTSAGRDVAELARRGDVNSMSFGFHVVKDKWNEANTERTLLEVRLFEVSAVTGWPAYPTTSALVRSLDADPDLLTAIFTVLSAPTGRLTSEQRDVLVAALNARTDSPVVAAALADYRQRFAAKGYVESTHT